METSDRGWIEDWFSRVEQAADFQVEPLALSHSKHWQMVGGAIAHDSGRFFRIAGTVWRDAEGAPTYRPMVEQREIGTLGFILRDRPSRAPELLAHAKIEPGNVNAVQLAPTCQATASNIACLHGGDVPPYSGMFGADAAEMVHQSLQSEQGSRFLGKLNRNVLVRFNGDVALTPAHRFVAVDEVLELVAADYVMNTDARSVLVTSPWRTLVRRPPFERYDVQFARELAESFRLPIKPEQTMTLGRTLSLVRANTPQPTAVPLDALEGWRVDAEGVVPEGGVPYRIRHIKVRARGREVAEWDQPIVESAGTGLVELHCGRLNGVLHFLFRLQVEPGLVSRAELGPTVCVEPGSVAMNHPLPPSAHVIIETWQSDEGGRFFQDKSLYRIVDRGQAHSAAEGYWLNVAQVHDLLMQGGWFTNEARSVLSLLLTWM